MAEPQALASATLSAPADSFDEQNTHTEDRQRRALESSEVLPRGRIGSERALALLENRVYMKYFAASQERSLARGTVS
jgi:hypothetical protein